MQSTIILERKDQVIENLTQTYLRITKRRLFNLRLFRKKTAQEMDNGLIEYSRRIEQVRLRISEYVHETHLTKEEMIEIKSLLLIKGKRLEESLYLRLISLGEFIIPVPCGLALVVLQSQIPDHVIEKYCLLVIWALISKKLINTKSELQRTINAYEVISHSFDDILDRHRKQEETV